MRSTPRQTAGCNRAEVLLLLCGRRWHEESFTVDVLVMTPEVLLHVLAHGALKVRRGAGCTATMQSAATPSLSVQQAVSAVRHVLVQEWAGVCTSTAVIHAFAVRVLQMTNIGLLVFDEAHHCSADHPYAQIMEDFYHVLEPHQRPQVCTPVCPVCS